MAALERNDVDYKIAFHDMCRKILEAVSAFKNVTGEESVNIETYDYEYDEEYNHTTGKFVKPGDKLGIKVYLSRIDDSDDDDE